MRPGSAQRRQEADLGVDVLEHGRGHGAGLLGSGGEDAVQLSGIGVPDTAARMVSRLETPGLASRSKRTSVPSSVTADLIFLAVFFGSSRMLMSPFGDAADLDIFDVGSCRS